MSNARAGQIIVTGEVLEVEHKQGSYEGNDYNFHLAHVLVGRNVVPVRFNPDNGEARPPAEGDTVSLSVELPKNTRVTAKRYVPAAAAKVA